MSVRDMTGLGIIVADKDCTRFRTALTLAASHAALGGHVRILLDSAAVPLAAEPQGLLESCFDLDVEITLCQTGMAESELNASMLDPRFSYGGMVGWLAGLGDDRLVVT